MKKLLVIACLMSVLASCDNRYEESFGNLLIDSPELTIGASAGEMMFYVYYDGKWTAQIEGECEWAELSDASGEGVGEVRMHYQANPLVSRAVSIIVSGGGDTKRIKVTQGIGLVPEMQFETANLSLPEDGKSVSVRFIANVAPENIAFIERRTEYGEGGRDWLDCSGFTVEEGSEPESVAPGVKYTYRLDLQASKNNVGMPRTAKIVCFITDAKGVEYSAVLNVSQSY